MKIIPAVLAVILGFPLHSLAAPQPGKWKLERETTKMGEKVITATLRGNETFKSWMGTIIPAIVLRCKEVAYSSTDSITNMYEGYFYLGVAAASERVRIRFDDGKPRGWKYTYSDDRKALFFDDDVYDTLDMMGAQKMLVEFTALDDQIRVVSFDLVGISEVVKPLREACAVAWVVAPKEPPRQNQ